MREDEDGASLNMPAAATGRDATQRQLPGDMAESTPDPLLDRIAAFAASLCEAPTALVSLVDDDHQRFLARAGTDLTGSARADSFCAVAMTGRDMLVVPDAAADPRFADTALVRGDPHVRFYAGVPLRDPAGNPLGALCVIDTVPRAGLSALQGEGLLTLAEAVMRLLAGQHGDRVRADADRTHRARLGESEERFRVLADTMPQMVWSTRPDGYHDYYNARWYEFTGMPPGSTDGEEWNGMFHPEDQDRAWAVWRHSLETGEPYQIEYRLRHRDGGYRWTLGRALPVRDDGGAIIRWFGTCTDIDAQKRAAEEREVISQELSHRIKNIFSVIAGLLGFAAKSDPAFRDTARDLRERVLALGRAHDFVRPHSQRSQPATGVASLKGLLEQLFEPYRHRDGSRLRIEGPDLPIDDRSATPFALLYHELATNAAKYGALSVPAGVVEIGIAIADDSLQIDWRERGGPPIATSPDTSGFGTQLLELAAIRQLGGAVERLWEPEGLHVVLRVPLASLSRPATSSASEGTGAA